MMSYVFSPGKPYRDKPKESHYALLYLVHVIAVCSVVGRIAAMMLYVLLDRY